MFDGKCEQEARASDLELGVVGVLHDPSGLQEEVLKNHKKSKFKSKFTYDEQNNLKLALKRTELNQK
jgi:hypothetical protein